jgi:hypothetical protein
MEIVRGFEELPLAGAMVTGTEGDSCIVWVFCTCNWAVPGLARLLLPIVPDNVLASTMVVVRLAPFHRMAAWVGKFVPVTFKVMV